MTIEKLEQIKNIEKQINSVHFRMEAATRFMALPPDEVVHIAAGAIGVTTNAAELRQWIADARLELDEELARLKNQFEAA